LAKYQQSLEDTKTTVVELKSFFATLKKDWSDIKDRIIGHVVWSPLFPTPTPATCVIELNKNKFLPNLRGNAIDLGACQPVRLKVSNLTLHILGMEIELGKFMGLLYPCNDVPSTSGYPEKPSLRWLNSWLDKYLIDHY
jgi:hypothetical protein